jgi:anti-sigma regulatory factor (Ser/Thr protein kinase)
MPTSESGRPGLPLICPTESWSDEPDATAAGIAEPDGALGINQVRLVHVTGAATQVGEPIDRLVQFALADNPRAVICSLPRAASDDLPMDPIASMGRHVQQWPAIPIAVACPDESTRTALRGHEDGRHLTVVPSIRHAWFEIAATEPAIEARLKLPSHPSAGPAARQFLTRTWLDWHARDAIETGCLVISELVTNAVRHSKTGIEVTLGRHDGLLRIAVRDPDPAHPVALDPDPFRISGRGIRLVETISRDLGVLPTHDGGKVVWATVNA